MKPLLKAQLTIGALAYFATVWSLVELARTSTDPILSVGFIILQLIIMIILSYVIIAMLEWIRLFDLKTNAIITLIVLVTLPILI